MLRFRVFSSATWGDDLPRFEAAVNDWLEEEAPSVRFVGQSSDASHLVVTFVYEVSTTPAAATVAAAEASTVPPVFEETLRDTALDPEEGGTPLLPEAELPY